MSELTDAIGQRVKTRRKELGYSFTELARISGVSRAYIYQIEASESSPTIDILFALAAGLDMSVTTLLGVDAPTSGKQICPKCNGQKHVWTPPWIPGDQPMTIASGIQSFPCPVCEATGLI